MLAIAIALGIQAAWDIVRAVLEHGGIAVHEPDLFALAMALATAVELVIATSALDLARRLAGTRRWGAALAAAAYAAMATLTLVYRALLHGAAAHHDWALRGLLAIREHGWGVVELVGISGFAVAAGGRAVWLAPLAAGAAWATERMTVLGGPWRQAEVIAFVLIKAILLVVIVAAAERNATTDAPDRERALHGLRRAELAIWIAAGLCVFWGMPAFLLSSVHLSAVLACVVIASLAFMASAAWTVARAALPGVPRWPWYATMTCALWGLARTLGNWGTALVWNGIALDPAHLHLAGWWADVPQTLASLSAAGALVAFGRHHGSRAVLFAAACSALAIAATFAMRVAMPADARTIGVCALCANLALVHLLRVVRAALAAELPRASLRRS